MYKWILKFFKLKLYELCHFAYLFNTKINSLRIVFYKLNIYRYEIILSATGNDDPWLPKKFSFTSLGL